MKRFVMVLADSDGEPHMLQGSIQSINDQLAQLSWDGLLLALWKEDPRYKLFEFRETELVPVEYSNIETVPRLVAG